MADNSIIADLDTLRPKSEYVKLGGNDIDISFVPSGVAIDLLGLKKELDDLAVEKDKNPVSEKKAFELVADMCAMITEAQYPDMTKKWLMKNTTINQLYALMMHVYRGVNESLGVDDEEGLPADSKSP